MNAKLNPPQFLKAVRYQWASNGTTCHGRTVVLSSSRAGLKAALKKFWHANNHVTPEAL